MVCFLNFDELLLAAGYLFYQPEGKITPAVIAPEQFVLQVFTPLRKRVLKLQLSKNKHSVPKLVIHLYTEIFP
jgi:hypothetical protein